MGLCGPNEDQRMYVVYSTLISWDHYVYEDSNNRLVGEMSPVPANSLVQVLTEQHEVVMRPFNTSTVVQPRTVRKAQCSALLH